MRPSKTLESSLSFLYQFVRKSFWVYLNPYHNVGIFYLSSPVALLKTPFATPGSSWHILGWPLCPVLALFSLERTEPSKLGTVTSLCTFPVTFFIQKPAQSFLLMIPRFIFTVPACFLDHLLCYPLFEFSLCILTLASASLYPEHGSPRYPCGSLQFLHESVQKQLFRDNSKTAFLSTSFLPGFIFSYCLSPNPRKTSTNECPVQSRHFLNLGYVNVVRKGKLKYGVIC